MRKTIRVRAGDGLSIPLPSNLTVDSGVTVLTPETDVEVLHNLYTRKRLASGDFVDTTPEGERDTTDEQPLEIATTVDTEVETAVSSPRTRATRPSSLPFDRSDRSDTGKKES